MVGRGSYLPDLVSFVPQALFSYKEIHEGGEEFLMFLKEEQPLVSDLALGMMTHSTKYGADDYSPVIEKRLLGNKPQLRQNLAPKIAACSEVSYSIANQARINNYLWSGIDLYLVKYQKKSLTIWS